MVFVFRPKFTLLKVLREKALCYEACSGKELVFFNICAANIPKLENRVLG
jgi:hypothetical protein